MSANLSNELRYPELREVMAAIPAHCFKINERVAFTRLGLLLSMTIGLGVAAYVAIPMERVYAPFWIAYAVANGSIVTGLWVLAHECSHYAFSERKRINTVVGFLIHSAVLIPYFTFRKSHAWHHARLNHLTEGETHVPLTIESPEGQARIRLQTRLGRAFAPLLIGTYFTIGWFSYVFVGGFGVPDRGITSHFWPFGTRLSPGKWRVIWSSCGIACTLALLALWGLRDGWVTPVLMYFGPYFVLSAWIIIYTWLHHTDVDVPQFGPKDWAWIQGAFQTVDRRYGRLLDFLHCDIGNTHVVHHLFPRIPHYNGAQATRALATAFPHLYRYDDTPVFRALWRLATQCVVVKRVEGDTWYF
jgi:fatty acid desaturase